MYSAVTKIARSATYVYRLLHESMVVNFTFNHLFLTEQDDYVLLLVFF